MYTARVREADFRMLKQGSRLSAILIALFVVFLWATSWVFIKIGLHEIPALTFAGLRYTLAFICLTPVLLLGRGRFSLPPQLRRGWLRLFLLGFLLYTVTQGAIFLALSFLPAVTVNLLWSFSTVTVAVFGILWLAERPTLFQWAGIALAALGAVVYFYPVAFAEGQVLGIIISVVGVVANAGAVILGRQVNRSGDLHPLVVTGTSMGFGSIVLLVTGIFAQGLPSITLRDWAIIAWLAVVNTAFAFTLWNHTLRTLSAAESSIINGTMLIWIPVLAVMFLGEGITTKEILGLVVAGAGTLAVQLRYPSRLLSIFNIRAAG
jgi:drug/metabolite transporter (DMT)-like permease